LTDAGRTVDPMTPAEDWVTASPAPRLRPFIDRYVGYRLLGFPPGRHRGLPSQHLTFIVSIGPPIDVAVQSDPGQAPDTYRCVLGGLQAGPALIRHDGNQEGVAIELTPLGSRALLGVPSGALWNLGVECSDVVGRTGQRLWERLQGPATWAQRFTVCDDVLAGLVVATDAVPRELDHAWRELVRTGGTVAVTQLASDIGWSRQHLARRFDAEFGLGPKLAARIVRFGRARRMLQSTPPFITIAQVAASCGYYDQAHLDRDFAALAGCSPTAWMAEELPSFQDDAAPGV
jgi:AraC-like DNA-binding protein